MGEKIIPEANILEAMDTIDEHVSSCLRSVHGVRFALRVQHIIDDDQKLISILNHYRDIFNTSASGILSEIEGI